LNCTNCKEWTNRGCNKYITDTGEVLHYYYKAEINCKYFKIKDKDLLLAIQRHNKEFPIKTNYSHESFDVLNVNMILTQFFNAIGYIYDVDCWLKEHIDLVGKVNERD